MRRKADVKPVGDFCRITGWWIRWELNSRPLGPCALHVAVTPVFTGIY